MTMHVATRERLVLERLRETYELQGYEFFIKPLPQMLPAFLGGFQPDAIALKPGDNHIVEVKFGRRAGEDRRLETLAALIAGQTDWQLKVFFEGEHPQDSLRFMPPTRSQIESEIEEAAQLVQAGHPKAALLLAWSVLEALARARATQDGTLSQRLFSPAQTVQSLEMAGVIDRKTGQELRTLAQMRNLAAHGDLATEIGSEAVDDLLGLLRSLPGRVFADQTAAAG
jgi:hypothetical protein